MVLGYSEQNIGEGALLGAYYPVREELYIDRSPGQGILSHLNKFRLLADVEAAKSRKVGKR